MSQVFQDEVPYRAGRWSAEEIWVQCSEYTSHCMHCHCLTASVMVWWHGRCGSLRWPALAFAEAFGALAILAHHCTSMELSMFVG